MLRKGGGRGKDLCTLNTSHAAPLCLPHASHPWLHSPYGLLLQELHRRLLIYYAQAEEGMAPAEGPLLLAYEDPLPLEDFYEVRQACGSDGHVMMCVAAAVRLRSTCLHLQGSLSLLAWGGGR